jgi:hypothetical protein
MEPIKLSREKAAALPRGVRLMVINDQATFVRMDRMMGGRVVPISAEEQAKLRKEMGIDG